MKKSLSAWSFFWPILGVMHALSVVKGDQAPMSDKGAPSEKSEKNGSEKVMIGIARMADISKASTFFKVMEKKLMTMQQSLQKKVLALRKEMDSKFKKLQALEKSNVNVKTIQAKQAALQKEITEKNAIIQAEQANIQNVQQGHMIEIFRQLKLIFKSLGEKHGLTIVIDSEACLYYSTDKTIDVTEEAITMLNAVKSEGIK